MARDHWGVIGIHVHSPRPYFVRNKGQTGDQIPMTQASDDPKRPMIRHLPLLVVVIVAVIGAFTLRDYLSFDTLRDNRESLLAYRDQNFWGMAM